MSEAGETRGGMLLRAHPESAPSRLPVPETRPPQSVEIPARLAGNWTARTPLAQPHGPAAEHFRHFALRLTRLLEARGGRSVAATSALRGEGKTSANEAGSRWWISTCAGREWLPRSGSRRGWESRAC
jgi:hypothetical protein